MKSHAFHPEARAEFRAEIRFYETQRPGHGWRFNDEVAAVVRHACAFPESGSPAGGGVRKLVTARFPFLIYYELIHDRVVIWAVMHGARRPGYWRRRRESPPL